jgi:hypothetical protein
VGSAEDLERTDYERWFSAIPTMIAFACRRLGR